MGTVFLVRHAQAAYGTEDYDRLTELGRLQSQRLGEWFARRQICFDAVYTGTLKRQLQTASCILDASADRGVKLREVCSALNEYDSGALLEAYEKLVPATTKPVIGRDPDSMRNHFRHLRDAFLAWTLGKIDPKGMSTFKAFQDGAVTGLTQAYRDFADSNVLVVSSGGPIAAIVAASLQAPPAVAVELHLRIRNTALSEFSISSHRHSLLSFNAIPHLELEFNPTMQTYA